MGNRTDANDASSATCARSPRDNHLGKLSCPGPELNQRHADFQSAALPTELPGRAGEDYIDVGRLATGGPAREMAQWGPHEWRRPMAPIQRSRLRRFHWTAMAKSSSVRSSMAGTGSGTRPGPAGRGWGIPRTTPGWGG